MSYGDFLRSKSHSEYLDGFAPVWLPDSLFDFQGQLVDWAIRKGRCAIFADCGLGKTLMQLVWAENVVRHTEGRVLVVTPLAVSHQTIREGEKFGIAVRRSVDGSSFPGITVTNYERLEHFDPAQFEGVVCDESSILKNFDGKRKAIITEFLRTRPYRLCCTATAAPNDYIELGTTSEALGILGFMDMLSHFFKNDQGHTDTHRSWAVHGGGAPKWRFKRHGEQPFWRWVCSWARAIRRPSDLGCEDGDFLLPELEERETIIQTSKALSGELFVRPAMNLQEQRQERRATIQDRCEAAARIVDHDRPAVVWCHLNDEGNLLARLIPDSVQVSGDDSDDAKEDAFLAFAEGKIRVLVTKPKIGAFGLNWQHCAHMTVFPSHSYEQYYQGVRRCWRFGQKRPVVVDIVASEGEFGVLKNLQRKSAQADRMFSELVAHMNDARRMERQNLFTRLESFPSWL